MGRLAWNEGLFSGNVLENGVMRRTTGKGISGTTGLCSPCWLPKRCLFWGVGGALEWLECETGPLGHRLGFWYSFSSELDCEQVCSVPGGWLYTCSCDPRAMGRPGSTVRHTESSFNDGAWAEKPARDGTQAPLQTVATVKPPAM